MVGKRVAQPVKKKKRTGRISSSLKALCLTTGIASALVLAAGAGFCAYAGAYENIFPGVTVGDVYLGGQTVSQAKAMLESSLGNRLSTQTVTVTSGGENLGVYSLSELGAYTDTDSVLKEAAAVGRESGVVAGVRNGIALVLGASGIKTRIPVEVRFEQSILDKTAQKLAEEFDREPLDASYELTREGLFATKHRNGRALEQEKLAEELSTAPETVEVPSVDIPAQPLDLNALAASLSPEPSPAWVDLATGEVKDGEVGVKLDVDAAQFALDAAAEGETIQLPAEISFPKMTAEELKAVLFRDLLGTATTNVSGTSVRKGNVKLAAECINGTILNPGDIFDYNKVVGERTTARGFGAAPSYVNGMTVNTVGGGICQVSSTLYLSALLSNLDIVERYNHRYYPGYITKGMDATVSWGGPEFRFKNDTEYPIRINTEYENSQLTISIYGTKTDDSYVKMTYETLSTTNYETVYEETEDLPYGTQQQKQSGYTGYKVNTFRSVYDGNGKLISKTLEATSNYSSRNRIIQVGIAGKPAETTPAPDTGETGTGEPPTATGETGTGTPPANTGDTGTGTPPANTDDTSTGTPSANTGDTGTGTPPANTDDTSTGTPSANTGDTGTDTSPANTGDTGTDTPPANTGDTGTDTPPANTGETGTDTPPANTGEPAGNNTAPEGDAPAAPDTSADTTPPDTGGTGTSDTPAAPDTSTDAPVADTPADTSAENGGTPEGGMDLPPVG